MHVVVGVTVGEATPHGEQTRPELFDYNDFIFSREKIACWKNLVAAMLFGILPIKQNAMCISIKIKWVLFFLGLPLSQPDIL